MRFRVGWGASSDASFRGQSDWQDAQDWGFKEDATPEDVEDHFNEGGIGDGLQFAIDSSGFEWYLEFEE